MIPVYMHCIEKFSMFKTVQAIQIVQAVQTVQSLQSLQVKSYKINVQCRLTNCSWFYNFLY